MKKCKGCQKEIDAKATKCPHCQTDQRNWFMRHKVLTVLGAIIALFILIGIIAASGGGSKDSTSTTAGSNGTKTDAPAQPAAIQVDAKKLSADYEANEVAADNQYKNKQVQISGTIKDIGKDILDSPYVSFENGNSIFGVQCMFDKSDGNALASLTKAQKITLTGKVSGKLGNVIVNDCKIVQ